MEEKVLKLSVLILGLNQEILDIADNNEPEFFHAIQPMIEKEVTDFNEDVNDDRVKAFSFPVRNTYNNVISSDTLDKFNEVKLKLKDLVAKQCPNEEFTEDELTDLTAMLNISTHHVISGIKRVWYEDNDVKSIICVVPVVDTLLDKLGKYSKMIDDKNKIYDLPFVTNMGKFIFKTLKDDITDKEDVRIAGRFGCRSIKVKITEYNAFPLDNPSQYLV